MRERRDWRAKRIFRAYFPPHSRPSFTKPLAINDLQKQGWIWVLAEVPKSRGPFHNLLIIKGSIKEVLAVGWKTCPAPETDTGREGLADTKKRRPPRTNRNEPGVAGTSSSRTAAAYSPALTGSTIGDGGLNFSVRDGKRWDPASIAAFIRHGGTVHRCPRVCGRKETLRGAGTKPTGN